MGFFDRFRRSKSSAPPAAGQGVLVPKVWSRAARELELSRDRVEGRKSWKRETAPLGEQLLLGVVRWYDGHLSEPEAGALGGTVGDVLRQASRNLEAMSEEPWVEYADGVFTSPWTDGVASSRVVLARKVREARVHGKPIAFVPSRDLLIITGSEDVEALDVAGKLAFTEFEEHERRITCVPLILGDDDVWRTWEPPRDHGARELLTLIRDNDWMTWYPEQGELLARELPKIHVAVPEVDEEGGLTVAWLDGRPNLLPAGGTVRFESSGLAVVDEVAKALAESGLAVESADYHQRADWDTVARVLPHHLRRTRHYPPRYETLGFPTLEELSALEARS